MAKTPITNLRLDKRVVTLLDSTGAADRSAAVRATLERIAAGQIPQRIEKRLAVRVDPALVEAAQTAAAERGWPRLGPAIEALVLGEGSDG